MCACVQVFASHDCALGGDKSFEQAVDLMSKLLRYEPEQRLQPLEALAHEFFDELRNPNTRFVILFIILFYFILFI